MNRYPTLVKTNLHPSSHRDRSQSQPAFLLILLMAALALGYWLHRSSRGVYADEGTPVSPITCFLAANYIPDDEATPGGILLAWRTAITDTSTIKFELARAQFTSVDSELRAPLFSETTLEQLQQKNIAQNGEEWRYTVVDTLAAPSTRYAYVLTMTETISGTVLAVDEQTWLYDDDPGGLLQNNEICLLGSTVTPWPPTPTRTPTSTFTPHPTDTATPLPPTHTTTPTWTPTPTNTQPPSPLVWPTDTPYPSPTFTPLPTNTPLPPTPTAPPTETPSPTFTPAISAPTPRFDPNAPQNSQWVDPNNSSILPTPEWTPTPLWTPTLENQQILPQETPTQPLPAEAMSQEAVTAESAPDLMAQEAIPAQAALMAAESSAVDETAARQSSAPPVASEYSPTRTGDGSSLLRLALYVVGGLALLSAFAFFVGALALFGPRPRS